MYYIWTVAVCACVCVCVSLRWTIAILVLNGNHVISSVFRCVGCVRECMCVCIMNKSWKLSQSNCKEATNERKSWISHIQSVYNSIATLTDLCRCWNPPFNNNYFSLNIFDFSLSLFLPKSFTSHDTQFKISLWTIENLEYFSNSFAIYRRKIQKLVHVFSIIHAIAEKYN